MIETHKETDTRAEDRLIGIWTRASEQVFEKLTNAKPEMHWTRQAATPELSEQIAGLEWWEAEYEGAGHHSIWIGIAPPAAVEIGRLAEALASGGAQGQEAPTAKEAVESLCNTFGTMLSGEAGEGVAYQGLKRLDAAPSPEVIYSSEIRLPPGSSAPVVVGFRAETNALLQPLLRRPTDSGASQRTASSGGSLDLLLDLELPLSVRFGRVQMPLESVLGLQPGSLVELDGSQDDQVDLLVNGSVVARGEVVAVEGQYGVRILEVLSRDGQIAASKRASEAQGA